ncbi:MAG: hypothetical protein M3Z00_13725, partial [Actinomycetota bacterium]|nr:hypothetical protein [Actinomycetota bacterium]
MSSSSTLSGVTVPGVTVPGVTVSLVTLGCARNEVDSSEIAGRLAAGGYQLLDEGVDERADLVVVNT